MHPPSGLGSFGRNYATLANLSIALLVAATGNMLDSVTTVISMNMGNLEAVALSAYLIRVWGFPGFFALKLGISSVFIMLIPLFRKKWNRMRPSRRSFAFTVFTTVAAGFAAVVAWNIVVILLKLTLA